MIDTSKLTPLEFCIIVTWLRGWTISKIHLSLAKRHGKTAHGVRGVINKIPKRRQDMTKDERQAMLDGLKANRIDDGMLPADYFVATPLASDQKFRKKFEEVAREPKPEPVKPNPKTRAGRAEIRRRKTEERIELERRKDGFAPRGIELAPLVYLDSRKLLDANGGIPRKGQPAAGMTRRQAGEALQTMLISAYGSGLKAADYESAGGGGGKGVVIHAVVAENLANIASIKEMMRKEEFDLIDRMLRMDLYVWQMAGKEAEPRLLDDVRRILDTVSVFLDYLNVDGFMERWGTVPVVKDRVDKRDVREANFAARDMIAQAQREVR